MKCYGGCGSPIIGVPRMCWLIGNDKQRWHVDCWNLFRNEVWGSHDINSTNSPEISVKSNTDISATGGKTYRDVGLQIPDAPSELKTYCDEGVQAPGLTSPRVHLTSIDEYDDSNLAAMDVDVEISEGVQGPAQEPSCISEQIASDSYALPSPPVHLTSVDEYDESNPATMDVDVEVSFVWYKRRLYVGSLDGKLTEAENTEEPPTKRFKPNRRAGKRPNRGTIKRSVECKCRRYSYESPWSCELKDQNSVESYGALREKFLIQSALGSVELNQNIWEPSRPLTEIAGDFPKATLHSPVIYENPHFAKKLNGHLELWQYLNGTLINLCSIPWPFDRGHEVTEGSIRTYTENRSTAELKTLQLMFHPDKWTRMIELMGWEMEFISKIIGGVIEEKSLTPGG
ncbi:hypothetical protein B0H13DRAFT_2497521 [Mycena leptocephala]|nr:hypothetical protein B0H13DRAFT_2497521 [Mycena leptocephala]